MIKLKIEFSTNNTRSIEFVINKYETSEEKKDRYMVTFCFRNNNSDIEFEGDSVVSVEKKSSLMKIIIDILKNIFVKHYLDLSSIKYE